MIGANYLNFFKQGKIKPFSRGKGLAPVELKAAGRDLNRSKKNYEEKDYKWATIQLYHSILHCAKALLYNHNLREQNQSYLISAMRELYANTKILPWEIVESLQEARYLGEDADYYGRWSRQGCKKLLKDARRFINAAKGILFSCAEYPVACHGDVLLRQGPPSPRLRRDSSEAQRAKENFGEISSKLAFGERRRKGARRTAAKPRLPLRSFSVAGKGEAELDG
jgi:uncharacterized protein (UPF0332 family)